MWIINAIVIHLLLLGSIFVIYFRSPVLRGLRAQDAVKIDVGEEPPAKRLVLLVTDGLRAESFFRNDCSDIPFIRSLMQKQGLVGISQTHVPTESRPGHIALIAGLYEDPSAVTRGWKENPIDFDNIFNRSARTYAWGANDVLHIFSRITSDERMTIDAYDHDLDFSGREETFELDEWVFKKVKFFLNRKGDELRAQHQTIYFLHLLGLDTAGHIYKPDSDLFLKNLHKTDEGIYDIYNTFQKIFSDDRTAYILTSDHGMTNSGSHGAGNPHETETPLYAWGSGILNKKITSNLSQKTFKAGNIKLPLHEIEQAQIAPLMAALLGIPPPVNNFGILPRNFINASLQYEAQSAYTNALQLLEQFQNLCKDFESGYFSQYLRSYPKLSIKNITYYQLKMDKHFDQSDFRSAIELSYEVMLMALDGIDYYQSYYKNILLFSTTLTMIGWMVYLFKLLLRNEHNSRISLSKLSIFLVMIGIFLLLFVLLQGISFAISFYILLPIFVWIFSIQAIDISQKNEKLLTKRNLKNLFPFLLLTFCVELLVLSFFNRKLISLVYLSFNLYESYSNFYLKDSKFYLWCSLVIALSIFPLLPPSVGYKNDLLILASVVMVLLRFFSIKLGSKFQNKIVPFIGIFNALLCIYQHSQQLGVSVISQIFSWAFLVFSFINILVNGTQILKHRVELIFLNLSTLYIFLSTSYEPMFVVLLSSEIILAMSMKQSQSLHSSLNNFHMKSSYDLHLNFRVAFSILLYTFFSFFGTGNIASVSSFDPNIIRCFLTTFSPFVIMSLVILKLIIPVIIIISIIFGLSEFARKNEKRIFICLLLLCDVMSLNFLYLVRNRGSWLEIGSSISHFVIMEVTTVVLLLLTSIAKLFLKLYKIDLHSLKLKILPYKHKNTFKSI